MVDAAPTFPVALNALRSFLSRHSLLQAPTGPRWRSASTPRYRGTSPAPGSPGLAPASPAASNAATSYSDDVPAPALRAGVAWVTHTPHDLRDFIPKQCWISAMHTPPPFMLPAPLVDVRVAVPLVASLQQPPLGGAGGRGDTTIDGLLQMLRLEAFQGRRHSGLADTQNIARIVVECARRVVEAAQEHRRLGQPVPPRGPSSSPRAPRTDDETLRAERLKALARTGALEESILPNTNLTKAAARKWHWMGRSLGEITWLDEEERDTDPDEPEEDIFVYTRREDASRSSARFSRDGGGKERLLWSSVRHSTSTSTMTSSSSSGVVSSSPSITRNGNGHGNGAASSPSSPAHPHAQPHTPTRQTARRGGGANGSRRAPTSPRNSRAEYAPLAPSSSEPSSPAPYSPPPSARSPYSARSYALHQQQLQGQGAPTSPAAHQHGRSRYRGYARQGAAAGTAGGSSSSSPAGAASARNAAQQQQTSSLYGSNGAW